MNQLTNLKLAAALAHTAYGAQLTLHSNCGTEVVVGRHPAADIHPCQLRAAVAAVLANQSTPLLPDGQSAAAAWISRFSFGGGLVDLGGGVLGSRTPCGLEQRWIATTLHSSRTLELLDDSNDLGGPADALVANVKPLSDLGVTVVVVTATHDQYMPTLERYSEALATRFLSEEFIRSFEPEEQNLPVGPTETSAREG